MKIIIKVTKNTDLVKKAVELRERNIGSEMTIMSMLDDARKQSAGIFALDKKIKQRTEIPDFKFIENAS